MSFNEVFLHLVMPIDAKNKLPHPITMKLVETKLSKTVSEFGGETLAVKLLPNHVHILVSVLPAASIDDLVVELKGETSELVEGTGRGETLVWAEGYGVVSVSKSHIDIVKNYIDTQEERHKTGKLNATLEKSA